MSEKFKHHYLKSTIIFSLLAVVALFGSPLPAAQAWNNGAANTPPLGWNSYDAFNWNVTEAQVKANADYMANNLKSVGWQYIIVDWAWYYPGSGTGSPNQTNLQPPLRMDANGRLLPDTTRFPSATGTNGFKPLADYIHSKGLKFGIHIMRGIPRQAVSQNTPILGTSRTANQINNSTTASWLNLMWGINMSSSGAQEYLNSLFQLYAAWGVDYVKVDDIAAPTYYTAEIQGYHNAIVNSGRNMVLSLSPGPTALSNGSNVSANANMWRLVNDLWDNWSSLDAEFAVLNNWTPYRTTGSWPDPDMIPIGHLALQGPVGSPRYSAFTTNEKRLLISLWAISHSPMMWGGNLVDNQASDLALMNNAAVMSVDQNSLNNMQLTSTSTTKVWVADVPNSTDKYLALFNEGSSSANVLVTLSSIGKNSVTATDLWSGSSLGTFTTTFTQSIPTHGAGLYRVSGSNATTTTVEAEATGNTLGGSAVRVSCSTASGGQIVGNVGNGGGGNGTLQFNNVSVSAAGNHQVTFFYINGDSANRTASMSVNGGSTTTVTFPPTGAWCAGGSGGSVGSIVVTVGLNAGNNSIKFSNSAAWAPDFDRLLVQ